MWQETGDPGVLNIYKKLSIQAYLLNRLEYWSQKRLWWQLYIPARMIDVWQLLTSELIISIYLLVCSKAYYLYDIWRVTCTMWHMTSDMYHVTYDVWHVPCDMWHVPDLGSGEDFRSPSTYGLRNIVFWRYFP